MTSVEPPLISEAISKSSESDKKLSTRWAFWTYARQGKSAASRAISFEDSMAQSESFDTIEGFFAVYNHLVRPGDWPSTASSDLALFRDGIKPMWEDEQNKAGGKWVLRLKKGLVSRLWEDMVFAVLGEQFDVGDEICGIVCSVRYNEDILAIWNKSARNDNVLIRIRDTVRNILSLPSLTSLEYKPHDAALRMVRNATRRVKDDTEEKKEDQ